MMDAGDIILEVSDVSLLPRKTVCWRRLSKAEITGDIALLNNWQVDVVTISQIPVGKKKRKIGWSLEKANVGFKYMNI